MATCAISITDSESQDSELLTKKEIKQIKTHMPQSLEPPELYKLIKIKGGLTCHYTNVTMVAVNMNQKRYFLISVLQLKTCDAVNYNSFICQSIQLPHNFDAENCPCETNLFNNNIIPNCRLKTLTTNVAYVFKQLQLRYYVAFSAQENTNRAFEI
uniref:Uncharacterized protein n=1 Tax=Glossina pallidipes TaxID=7398 RepID=A0A1B0A366_GLOPL